MPASLVMLEALCISYRAAVLPALLCSHGSTSALNAYSLDMRSLQSGPTYYTQMGDRYLQE